MTQNQIAYWELQRKKEQERANLAESSRHNRAQESLGAATLTESGRHNRATESNDLLKLAETGRHNLASEDVERGKLAETSRHNVASEVLSKYGYDVSKANAAINAAAQRYVADSRAGTADLDRISRELVSELDRDARVSTSDKDRLQRYLSGAVDNLARVHGNMTNALGKILPILGGA